MKKFAASTVRSIEPQDETHPDASDERGNAARRIFQGRNARKAKTESLKATVKQRLDSFRASTDPAEADASLPRPGTPAPGPHPAEVPVEEVFSGVPEAEAFKGSSHEYVSWQPFVAIMKATLLFFMRHLRTLSASL